MFEHFTFGLPSRPEGDSIREVSPTDTSGVPRRRTRIDISDLITPCSPSPLDDLISAMSSQNVDSDSLSPTSYNPLSPSLPSLSSGSDTSEDCSHSAPSSPTEYTQHQPFSPYADRRLQRQLHTQLQSSATHIRSINALVEQMVATGSQCTTASPPPTKSPLGLSIQNDYFDNMSGGEDGDDLDMSLRRARAPSGIRKPEARIVYRGRAEMVAKATGAVRASRPKMRLRRGGRDSVPAVKRKE